MNTSRPAAFAIRRKCALVFLFLTPPVFFNRRDATKQPLSRVQVKNTGSRATRSRSIILIASPDSQLRVRSRLLKMKSSLSPFVCLVGIALLGLAGFPSPALSQAINPGLVQKTLNPLPTSVLIPSSAFTGSLVSLIPRPGTTADGVTAKDSFIWFWSSGDLTNDGYPEVASAGGPFQLMPTMRPARRPPLRCTSSRPTPRGRSSSMPSTCSGYRMCLAPRRLGSWTWTKTVSTT